MSFRIPGNIRFQMVLLVIVAMLPAAGLLFHQAEVERAQAVRLAESQAVSLVSFLRRDQERMIEGARQLLSGLARMPFIKQRDWPQCSEVLSKLRQEFPLYANLGVTDENGMAVASALPMEGPLDLSRRTWFLRAKKEGCFVIGDFQVSRVAKKPTVDLALPVYDENHRLEAVLVAALDLGAMYVTLSRFPLPEGSVASLTDFSGTILSRFPKDPSIIGRQLGEDRFRSHFLRHRPKTLFLDQGTDGVTRYYVTDRLMYEPGKGGVFVCVGLSEKGIFAEANTLFRQSLIATLLTLAVVIALAWFLSGFFFTRKIRRLVRAARNFGAGDIEARSGLSRNGGEIGALASSFDEMAESLADHIKRAEEANRHISFQKTLLECQSEASPDGIVVVSPEGKWLYTNRRFRELWGIPEEIFARGDANEALAWAAENKVADPAKWKKAAMDMRQDPETESEDEILLRDGRVLSQHTAPVRDGQGRHYGRVYYHRDVTREKADRERFARLVTAMDQSAEEIIMTDAAGVIEYVNPAFTLITGYEKNEAEGKTPSFLNSGEQDDRVFKEMWAAISHGQIWKGRLVNRRKDGSTYIKEAAISPVRDASGMTINYVSVGRDVTEKAAMEKSLRQAQKMEAIGTLAGGIAHDFNNILAAIMGYAELATMEFAENPKAGSYLAEVLKAGRRAEDLVRQILLFSHQVEQEKRPVLLQPIIKEALKLLRGSLPSHIEMATSIDPDIGPVNADPTQVHQVIMNLATNSYHAMKERGGVLSVSLSQVIIGSEQAMVEGFRPTPGKYARISVSDTGAGIPETVRKRIFDPYFTTKNADEGTGLGLSTVHGIVKSHNGAIDVTSEPGKGSTFVILLPLANGRDEASESDTGPEKTGQASGRVLYVDDEDALVDMGSRLLSTCGFSVTAFADPREAVRAFSESPEAFDVVLSDVLMPKMNGLVLAEKIHEIRPDIPIVFCTGFSESLSMEKAASKGVVAIVMKPILKSEIQAVLEEAILKKKQTGEKS